MQRVSGLNNLGNTCYLNTTLQCLFRCDDFVTMLMGVNPRPKGRPPPTIHLKNLALQMNVKDVSSPNVLISAIEEYAKKQQHSQFQMLRRQHDMSEFMLFLIDFIHTEVERSVSIHIDGKPKDENEKQIIQSMVQFKGFFAEHYSDLIPLFFGQYQSSVHTLNSNKFSYNYDPFVTIQLDIPPPSKKSLHLYDCFNHFSETESIKTDTGTLHKYIHFWKLPQYLIIVLKRFSYTGRKRNENIEIPHELDLRRYTEGPEKFKSRFSLVAVGNHRGSTRGGHYYAFVKDAKSETWMICNDNTFRCLNSKKSISTPFAYCLFYKKVL